MIIDGIGVTKPEAGVIGDQTSHRTAGGSEHRWLCRPQHHSAITKDRVAAAAPKLTYPAPLGN
jgi:hypothetical protein